MDQTENPHPSRARLKPGTPAAFARLLLFVASAIVFGQLLAAISTNLTGADPLLTMLIRVPGGALIGAVLGELFVIRHYRR